MSSTLILACMGGKIRNGATIKLHRETRDRLKTAKRGGETYDDLINRLLDAVAVS